MMEKRKKIILCCAGLFAFFLSFYYAVALIVSVHFFKQPAPNAATLGKYIVSRVADAVGFPWLYFRLPEEFKTEILKEAEDMRQVHWRSYHYLLDGDNVPHIRFFYYIFPWYAAAAAGVSLAVYAVKNGEIEATPEAKRNDVFVRGVRRVDPGELCKRIKKNVVDPVAMVETDGGALLFSGARLREHMAIFGASGSGKSQYLLSLLFSFFRNKGEETRVIVVDRKGEFYAYFGTEGDILYNPYDSRSEKWSVFNELDVMTEEADEMPPDVKAIAKILFPERGANVDPFWQQAAADVFCSAVMCCIRAGTTTNKDLINFCNQKAADIIREFSDLPDGLAAGRVIGDDPQSMTAGSILSVLKAGLQPLAVCPDGAFSVRAWMQEDGGGNLFLSSAGKNDTVFIPVLALFIDLIGRELKEAADSGAGGVRYLIVIDELAAYNKMNTLHYLVAEARSKGVSVVIATQTIQKILQVYGEKDGKDILGNAKTKVIFRTIEASDARYLSETIGASEIQRTQRAENENASTIFGKMDGREGETMTKQIVSEPVFLPGDLQTLDTGRAVVIHPAAGEAVAALQFAPFRGEKRGREFDPIKKERVAAREYAAETAKKAEAERIEKEKREEEQRKKDEREMIDRLFPTTKKKEPEPQPNEEKADRQPATSSAEVDEKTETAPEKEKEEPKKKGYLL